MQAARNESWSKLREAASYTMVDMQNDSPYDCSACEEGVNPSGEQERVINL